MVDTTNSREKRDITFPTGLIKLSVGKVISLFIKRIFDIFVSSLGLVFLAPWFILIMVLIKHDSPGPAFFRCRRIGLKGRPFRMLKFRTMYERPESYQGPPVTFDGDNRITPLGQWLRDTKVNELPQLWNVLIGEMSLVGPRPEDVDIANEWPEEAKSEILSVRPGITSPASIIYHDEEHKINSVNVMGEYIKNILPDKMRLDRLYLRNQSFYADLDIIFWTMTIFIPRIAKTKIPEGLLFSGPISRLIHRYINWFFIDLLISVFIVGTVGLLWRIETPLNWGFTHMVGFAIILAFLFSGVNSLAGLNKILWSQATVSDGMSLVLSGSIVTLFILVLNEFNVFSYWLGVPSLPMVLILTIGMLAQIGFLTARYRLRILTSIASRWLTWRRSSSGVGERVLIVGMGEGFKTAVWLLKREEYRYLFTIVGVVDSNFPTQLGMWVNGCLVLGRIVDIPDLVEKHDIGVILFAKTDITSDIKNIISKLCQTSHLRIAFINQMIDILSQQLTQPVAVPERFLWSQDHLRYFALYDAVTGLPNRFYFGEQLHRSLAFSRRYRTITTVIFISLDGFTSSCETFGQKYRPEFLNHVAKRLLHQKRESDTLAYLDNDEFGLILENIPGEDIVYRIAKRIKDLIAEPFYVEGNPVVINSKISVCTNLCDCKMVDGFKSDEIDLLKSQRRPMFISEGD